VPANTSLNLVDLDFDGIKESLKSYLSEQPQFLDYDFDSSNMNVLLDILAYNTFHNGFYLNMVAAESYLDSAQLRNSVVSHAKELNYLPRSYRSAKATLNISFSSNTNMVTIPKGTSFTSLVGFGIYTFVTAEQSVHFSANGTFLVSDLDVYEGVDTTDTFIVDYNNSTQRFVITDPKVDTRSITIDVIEDNDGTSLVYTQASTTLDQDDDSQIYFVQGAEDGKYEVVFGDGIIGRRPKNGAIVQISYRVCNGSDANGAARFTLDDEFANFTTTPNISTVDLARGGAEAESIESIKFYAPRYFQTQERAVNTSDYEIILQQRFPEINAISAYGGEDVTPAQYGRVFIAVDISDVDGLPTSKINEYLAFIRPRSPLSIDPSFVEPDYTYYRVESTIKYNVNETNYNTDQIQSLVVNRIVTYDETNLNNFKASFRYSKFLAAIDDIDDAGIVSNDTDIIVYKKIVPDFGVQADYDLNFDIALTEKGGLLGSTYDVNDLTAVYSSEFVFNSERVYVADDGQGILRLVKNANDSVLIVRPNIGSVDYDTGAIQIVDLQVDAIPDSESEIRVFVVTAERDFATSKNVILALESSQIEVEVVPIRENATSPTQSRQRG
jgi:hypothetical protein